MNKMNGILSGSIALAWALVATLAPASALAEEVYLQAQQFDKTVLNDGGTTTVPMWGYGLCTGTGGVFDSGSCSAPTSPGPVIEVTEGMNLTVYVDNQLPALTNVTTETSVLIPALPKGLSPVRWPVTGDPSRDNRIYSFDAVTANGAVGTYVWTAPSPGTYLYHSGTHPQVQVQMGLYGAVVVRAATTVDCPTGPCAYADVPYDEEAVVVFSEIDPALHSAVASDIYGTAGGPTSTEMYVPRFFLINGESFPSTALDPLLTAPVNNDVLLRMVNAGIEDHAPQLLGEHFELIAEDGYRAPASRSQYTLLMGAGKTKDVIFRPGVPGQYTLFDRRLRTVNDTGVNGGMFARINAVNSVPIADAGPNQNILVTDTVTLDGSGSSDVNGDTLTYAWTFTSVPGTSTVTDGDLSDATAIGPTFDPDVDGEYVVQLTVNDGTVDSAPDSVTITTAPNTPPVAVAGPDQTVPYGAVATLDGSGSNDDDGNVLTYLWTFTSVPGTSAITDGDLSDATAESPTFTPDVPGDYIAQVIVNDGIVDSPPDTVTITAENIVPVADAGPDQGAATTGLLVTLDGSGSSDTNGEALTYAWTITAAPGSSTITTGSLSDATAVGPTFTPDLPGVYTAQLVVNDGTADSLADTVDITALDPVLNIPPVANAGGDQTVDKSDLVQLNGGLSSDGDTDPLTYAWQLTVPTGSTAILSDANIVNPTFTADLAGDYIAQLIVNDGTEDSVADTVTITATNTAPVANAGGDMNTIVGNPVQLDGSGSSDANGDSLTYAWQLTVPTGSTATLSDATIVNPTFVPDVAGAYIAQLIVNDGTTDSAADTGTTTATVGGGGTGPFEQTGGILSMEAEHFATNNAASGVAEWTLLDPSANASNVMAIKAAGGAQTYTSGVGPTVTYEAEMDAGTHSVWVRYRSFSGSTDSFFFQLDGGPIQTRQLHPDDGVWHWVEVVPPITVGTAGVHTLTIYRRERETEIDKIVLATDPSFDPALVGGGLGPDESPRVGGGGNTPPMSNAGPDQNVKITEVVQLNGGASSDVDSDPLTYSWSLIAPAGSTATLSDTGIVNPTFTADMAGSYVAQLIVNDGLQNGLADAVTITAAPNTVPTANAGPDDTVAVSGVYQLDGSGSSDADGDSLTYAWDLFPIPAGSTATISNAALVNPTFTADLPGAYTATLIVHDGFDSSVADSVVITAENTAPVADAGPDQAVATSDVVQLDGSGSSDANGDSLTYAWQLTVPDGSTATLSNATIVNPTFTADVDGEYTAQLIVNDGTVDSLAADIVIVTASTGGGTGPFEQIGGILSMEAEHFATNNAASGVAEWTLLDPSANASSVMAIKAAGGAQTYSSGVGPTVTYEAQMDAGTNSVWVRYRSFSGSTDSFFFQLDGGPIQTRQLHPDDGVWHWVEVVPPVTVGTAGMHTVTIYRRERETEIDKLVLTTNPGFDPNTINGGLGPDESPRL